MSDASADWIVRAGVCIPPGLDLSFQRYIWPEIGVVDRAPASLGALPVGFGLARDLILPLAADECFWIGLRSAPAVASIALAVGVELLSGQVLDAISGMKWNVERPSCVTVPDMPRIEGIRRPDGHYHPFARQTRNSADPVCVCLRLWVSSATNGDTDNPVLVCDKGSHKIRLRLVDYAAFAAESGLAPPTPIDPNAGYKGWLLP